MIQRIQTVYLTLAAVLLSMIFAFDRVWTGTTAAEFSWFVPATAGIFGLAAVGSITSIFLFKDQKRQRKVVVALQFVTLVGLIVLFTAHYLAGNMPSVTSNASFGEWAVLGSPAVAYLMFLMARRGIDKDIKLIKSMDRLR